MPDPETISPCTRAFRVEPDDDACYRCHYIWTREFDRLEGVHGTTINRATPAALGVEEHELGQAAALLRPDRRIRPTKGIVNALRRLEITGVMFRIVSNSDCNLERRLEDFALSSKGGQGR